MNCADTVEEVPLRKATKLAKITANSRSPRTWHLCVRPFGVALMFCLTSNLAQSAETTG